MKCCASLSTKKLRHKDCIVVKRGKKTYVLCKTNPRYKARQGH